MVRGLTRHPSAFSSSCGAPEGRELRCSLQREGRCSLSLCLASCRLTTAFSEPGQGHHADFFMALSFSYQWAPLCLSEAGEERNSALLSHRDTEVSFIQTQQHRKSELPTSLGSGSYSTVPATTNTHHTHIIPHTHTTHTHTSYHTHTYTHHTHTHIHTHHTTHHTHHTSHTHTTQTHTTHTHHTTHIHTPHTHIITHTHTHHTSHTHHTNTHTIHYTYTIHMHTIHTQPNIPYIHTHTTHIIHIYYAYTHQTYHTHTYR
jgi:hypothetical protein